MAETAPAAETLDALRAEIDALDDALHGLLMRRAAVVARLARSAAKPAGTVLRPGREAAILRRLLAAHSGAPPASALVRIWREIFASSLAQQAAFRVALGPGAGLERLAAQHFGTATPLIPAPDCAGALARLAGGEASVAVLPWPRADEATPWWPGLEPGRASVIARLPFLAEAPPEAEAAVLALYPADPSGRDATLFRQPAGAPAPAGARPLARAGDLALFETEAAPPAQAVILGRYAIPERGSFPA